MLLTKNWLLAANIAAGIGGFVFKAIKEHKTNKRNIVVDTITKSFKSVAKATNLKEPKEDILKEAASSAVDAFSQVKKLLKGKKNNAFFSALYAVSIANKIRNDVSNKPNGKPKSTMEKVVDAILEDVKEPKKSDDINFSSFNNITSIIENIAGTKGNLRVAQLGSVIPQEFQNNPVILAAAHLSNIFPAKQRTMTFDSLFNPWKETYFNNVPAVRLTKTMLWWNQYRALEQAERVEKNLSKKKYYKNKMNAMKFIVEG